MPDLRPAHGERRRVRCRDTRDPPTRRGGVADHEEACNRSAVPASLARDLSREARLPVEGMERRLAVRHHGLHLDDQDDAGCPVIRKDVNRPAFTPDRIRNLDRHVPARHAEEDDDEVDKAGVTPVEEPIELLAVPSKSNVESRSERSGSAVELVDPDVADQTAVDPGDDRPRSRASLPTSSWRRF